MVAKRDPVAVAAFVRGTRSMKCFSLWLSVLSMIGALVAAPTAFAASALDEVRSAFTVEGKPIPRRYSPTSATATCLIPIPSW